MYAYLWGCFVCLSWCEQFFFFLSNSFFNTPKTKMRNRSLLFPLVSRHEWFFLQAHNTLKMIRNNLTFLLDLIYFQLLFLLIGFVFIFFFHLHRPINRWRQHKRKEKHPSTETNFLNNCGISAGHVQSVWAWRKAENTSEGAEEKRRTEKNKEKPWRCFNTR